MGLPPARRCESPPDAPTNRPIPPSFPSPLLPPPTRARTGSRWRRATSSPHSLRLRRVAGALPRPPPRRVRFRDLLITTQPAGVGRARCVRPAQQFKVRILAGGGVAEHVGGGRGEEARHARRWTPHARASLAPASWLVDGAVRATEVLMQSIDRTLTMRSEVLGLELREGPRSCVSTTRRRARRYSATSEEHRGAPREPRHGRPARKLRAGREAAARTGVQRASLPRAWAAEAGDAEPRSQGVPVSIA